MKQFAAAIMLALGAIASNLEDQNKPYISAEIRSKDQFQYGRFMTKMQGSDRHGTIATFMTLWLGDEEEKFSFAGWNHINLELVPHAFNKVTTNLIWKNFTNEWDKVKNFDPSNNWHEYDIRWTPEHITFIIDGVERRREIHTDDDFNEALADINKKHHIIMNFWTPDWCAEHLESDESMPWYTRYEYVKAYDYKGKDATGEDIFEMRW
jgi:beta-glucanase (GH16 family)